MADTKFAVAVQRFGYGLAYKALQSVVALAFGGVALLGVVGVVDIGLTTLRWYQAGFISVPRMTCSFSLLCCLCLAWCSL